MSPMDNMEMVFFPHGSEFLPYEANFVILTETGTAGHEIFQTFFFNNLIVMN